MAVALRTIGNTVLTLVDPRAELLDVREWSNLHGLDSSSATDLLTRALAEVVTRAVNLVAPVTLILTGGDTARAVCLALGAQALEIEREAAPGIPISRLRGGKWDGLTVVTKAGGFGDAETLARIVDDLRRERGTSE